MERNLDKQGRWRNKTVSFRMSKEEVILLDNLVALSGLTKQDYIIKRLLCKDIVVVGNTRVYKALKNQIEQICIELQKLTNGNEIDDVTTSTIQFINQILKDIKEENQ
ncbi:mobilization protein [Lachnospiraceae bacterium 46-61]